MRKHNIPVTRENYIEMCGMGRLKNRQDARHRHKHGSACASCGARTILVLGVPYLSLARQRSKFPFQVDALRNGGL
jgi:hypothetical protein